MADSAVVQTDSGRTNVPFSGPKDFQEHSVTDTEDWGTTVASPHGLKGLSPASLPVPLSSCGTTSSTIISASFMREKKPKADSGRETGRQKAYKDDKNISPQNQKDGRLPNEEFGACQVACFSIDIEHKISQTYLISSASCLSINCACCCPDAIG